MHKRLKSSATAAAFAALLAVSAGGYAQAADMPVKAAPAAAKPVPFFFVNDTSVSFTDYFNAKDPGIPGSMATHSGGFGGTVSPNYRLSGSVDHFDVWEYGTNLFHIEFNQYSPNDPNFGKQGANGAREAFGFFRSTFGLNELTHSKTFSNLLFTDVGLEVGGTAGQEENWLGEETTQFVAGLNFNVNLPGTVLVSILAYKEFTHNNFDTCGPPGFASANGASGFFPGGGVCNVLGGGPGANFSGEKDYQWTWKMESFIAEPLKFLPESFPVTLINVLNITGPKGTGISGTNCFAMNGFCGNGVGSGIGGLGIKDELGINESKVEVFEDVRLSLDTSKVFWGKPGIWSTYVGYRYWYNKFGANHNDWLFNAQAPGSAIEATAYVGTTYHFK